MFSYQTGKEMYSAKIIAFVKKRTRLTILYI